MKKFILITLLFIFSIQLNAQLKKFNVEIPQQPKFKISDSIQSLLLLNRSMSPTFQNYNEDSLQIAFFKKNFDANLIILDSIIADTTLQVLGEMLFDSDRFDIIIPIERNIQRDIDFTKTPEPLPWDFVENVCKTYQTDALVVLENIATRVVTNYKTGREYIGFEEHKTHYASMDFYYRAHWRVYHPNSKNILVDFIMSQDTIYWDNFDYGLLDLFKGLPSVKEAGILAGIKIAVDFSEIITPSWIQDTRYYYITKNMNIDKSIKMASEGNWGGALENWLHFSSTGSKSTQSKTMLNIALGYEMTGDLSSAIEWTKKSIKTYYREVANHYLKELMKRQILLEK